MSKAKYCPKKSVEKNFEPFFSVEDAWFWFCRCMLSRQDGLRGNGNHENEPKPCEVGDIYLILRSLIVKNLIGIREVEVMKKFGFLHAAPDTRFGASLYEVKAWAKGIAALSEPLKLKEIVL